jgi:hypothetical protein
MNEQEIMKKKRGRPKKVIIDKIQEEELEKIKEEVKEETIQENKTKAPEPIEDNEPMSDRKMDNILIELQTTYYWIAIKRFLDMQYIKVRDSLLFVDPSQQTSIAKQQGIISGVILLETYINQIKAERAEKKAEEEGKSTLPSYNS